MAEHSGYAGLFCWGLKGALKKQPWDSHPFLHEGAAGSEPCLKKQQDRRRSRLSCCHSLDRFQMHAHLKARQA
jgi:hypothetical protein